MYWKYVINWLIDWCKHQNEEKLSEVWFNGQFHCDGITKCELWDTPTQSYMEPDNSK